MIVVTMSPWFRNNRENVMKMRGVVGAVVAAALLSSAPFSLVWSFAKSGSLSLTLDSAAAADMTVPARRAYRSYYRSRSYDLYCGGPYVGSGWNGGTYWGGPWMELSCYGYVEEPAVRVEEPIRVKG
jgi:hypothetical protein